MDSLISVKLLNSGIGTKCEDGLRRRQHNLNVRFCTRSVHWLPGNIETSLLLILGFIFISSYYHIPTTISSYSLCLGHLFCSYGFLCLRPSRFPLIAYVSLPGLALDMSILTLARYYSLTWSFPVSSFLHLPYVPSFDLFRVHAVSIITHTFLNVYTSIIYHRNSIFSNSDPFSLVENRFGVMSEATVMGSIKSVIVLCYLLLLMISCRSVPLGFQCFLLV